MMNLNIEHLMSKETLTNKEIINILSYPNKEVKETLLNMEKISSLFPLTQITDRYHFLEYLLKIK